MIRKFAFILLLIAASAGPGVGQTPKPTPTRTPPQRPASPVDARAVRTAADEVTVTWQAVAGVTEYRIGRHVPPDGWRHVARVAADSTSYVDKGRDLTKKHQYSVVAINGPVASTPVQTNEILPGSPISNATKTSPPADGDKHGVKEGQVFSADPAGCATAGGYHTCVSPVISMWAGEFEKSGTVYCPDGSFATGGGFSRKSGAVFMRESKPTAVAGKGERPGWTVLLQRMAPPATTDVSEAISSWLGIATPIEFSVYVICAPPR